MSKPRIFLIHGWGGGPQADWFPWATAELGRRGYQGVAPQMPDTDAPVIGEWVPLLAQLVGQLRSTDIFVGHSIGCQTILRYLERGGEGRADKVILVAPWVTLANLESDEMWAVADPWLKTPLDWGKIKPRSSQFLTIFSDNDPWVPYAENSRFFRTQLNPQIITIHNRGHMSAEEGSSKLSELLQFI